jgi:hypothetical protein
MAPSGFSLDKPSLVKAVISSLDNEDSDAIAPIKANKYNSNNEKKIKRKT